MSEINYLSINENFPVAGQDNDTQVFRDNFDTIKNSLRIAKEEITDLESNGARLDQANDYNSNTTENTILQNVSFQTDNRGAISAGEIEIDFTAGSYHILNIDSNKTFEFTNFPGDPAGSETVSGGVGKVTLELYTTPGGGSYTISFITSAGTVIKKDADFPSTLTVNSATDPIIVDVWRHPHENTLFMKYVGQFSE